MRTPSNEHAGVEAGGNLPSLSREGPGVGGSGESSLGDACALDRPHSPTPTPPLKGRGLDARDSERRCILSGERADPASLVRLALAPDGRILPDVRAKAPGRGAWISVDRAALRTAVDKGKLKGALSRAFKTGTIVVPADLPDRIEEALARAALDRLGLEARGGTLVTGGERIERAARDGKLHLLLHARDAAADGTRRLDQAWRVGRDAEGSGAQGLTIAADRTILSLALGRENVVHLGVADAGAAARVGQALDRWHRFIGFSTTGQPCETRSQGSTPLGGASGGSTAEDRDGAAVDERLS